VALWREGLHQPVCSKVSRAVEEPPPCSAVCAAGLAAGSTLSHHQVADGLAFPATRGQAFLRPSNVADADSTPQASNSLYLNILSSHPPTPHFRSTLHLHSFDIFCRGGGGVKNQL
jgi:hypothetical protein